MLRASCLPVVRSNLPEPLQPYRPLIPADLNSPTPFVILTRPRSGSNFLVSLLAQHPGIRCDAEALHPDKAWAGPPRNWTVADRDNNRHTYLDALLSGPDMALRAPVGRAPSAVARRTQDGLREAGFASSRKLGESPLFAVGFKTFNNQLTLDELTSLALSPTVKKIVLRRKNLVDIYLSELKAQTVGDYYQVDTSHVSVYIKPQALIDFFHQEEKVEMNCIDEARRISTERYGGDDWLSVDYDELTGRGKQGEAAVLAQIVKFLMPGPLQKRGKELRVDQRIVRTTYGYTLTKQDTSRRNESIANFDEVWASLASMPRYRAMLVE